MILDSRFYSGGYTTEEARQVFCDQRRLQRWLDIEVALALSQAELGLIPQSAANELQGTARLEFLDLDAIKEDIAQTGHSLIPLLNAWQKNSSAEAGKYIHFGATTQDIQDTAQSLELQDIFVILERDTGIIIKQLVNLAQKYRDLVMIGRTHGQQALPTTLGAKIAVWLDEMATVAQPTPTLDRPQENRRALRQKSVCKLVVLLSEPAAGQPQDYHAAGQRPA